MAKKELRTFQLSVTVDAVNLDFNFLTDAVTEFAASLAAEPITHFEVKSITGYDLGEQEEDID